MKNNITLFAFLRDAKSWPASTRVSLPPWWWISCMTRGGGREGCCLLYTRPKILVGFVTKVIEYFSGWVLDKFTWLHQINLSQTEFQQFKNVPSEDDLEGVP